MNHRRKFPRVAGGLLAAIVLPCVAASPAEAQRAGVVAYIGDKLEEAVDFIAGPRPTERVPRDLRRCGSLYAPDAARIARGPELLNSHERWINGSLAVVRQAGGPLPLCFDYRQETLTSSQGQYLLDVNNHFLRANRGTSYVLTGFTDPVERDTALARKRAEEIQLKSTLPVCRYRARRGPTQIAVGQYRKVEYTLDPASNRCPRPTR